MKRNRLKRKEKRIEGIVEFLGQAAIIGLVAWGIAFVCVGWMSTAY